MAISSDSLSELTRALEFARKNSSNGGTSKLIASLPTILPIVNANPKIQALNHLEARVKQSIESGISPLSFEEFMSQLNEFAKAETDDNKIY